MDTRKKTIYLYGGGAVALLLLLTVTYLLRPIADLDFFWHLKTGEWIWLHGQLPASDPFNFTATQNPDARQLFILQGYPVAQLSYYGLYQCCGWFGIYLLRFLLVAGFLTTLVARCRLAKTMQHFWPLAGALLLLFVALVIESYPLDRPQVFSFLFFGLLLLLYDWAIQRSHRRPLWSIALPAVVITAVWGNTHGGSLLGFATLALIGGAEGLLFLLKRRDRAQARAIAYLVAFGLAGCFLTVTRPDLASLGGVLNPRSQKLFLYNYEYFSTIQYYKAFSDINIVFFWIVMAVVAVVMVWRRPLDKLGEMLILLVVGYFSFTSIRYIPFFVIVAIPFLYTQLTLDKTPLVFRYAVALACIALFSFEIADEFKNGPLLAKNGAISAVFPVAATDFVVKNDLRGRIFNPYDWGGYLLWRLSPERKIYQDGRALNETVFIDWLSCLINMKGGSGRMLWQEILDKYEIDVAILPKLSKETPGKPHELTYPMSKSPEWRVVYHDKLAVVLARVRK